MRAKLLVAIVAISMIAAGFADLKNLKPGFNLFSSQQDIEVGRQAALKDSESIREHRAIISAFRSVSADAIEAAIRLNWLNSTARMSQGSGPRSLHGLGDYRMAGRKA